MTHNVTVMSNFSEHDPSGQGIKAARGLTRYPKTGWRRWLVPSVLTVIGLCAVALVIILVTR